MVGFEEKALCRKIAKTFEFAGMKGYPVEEFTKEWLESDTAKRIYDRDFNEIAQSSLYVLNSLLKEKELVCDGSGKDYTDLFFWLGYTITYMQFYLEISPEKLWNKYDIIGFAGSYDVLHTLSSKTATEECVNEHKRP